MLINLLCAILTNLFVQLHALNSVKQLAQKANQPFVFKKYLEAESIAIISGLIPIAIWALIYNEVGQAVPQAVIYVRLSFVFIGAAGAWLLTLFLGKSKKWIRNVIDEKTNELDEVKAALKDTNIQ